MVESDDDEDNDGGDDDVEFSGLATAEYWLATDTVSVYVDADVGSEFDISTNVVPMRSPPETDYDVSLSSSWLLQQRFSTSQSTNLLRSPFRIIGDLLSPTWIATRCPARSLLCVSI